jgi:small GTP-binding protein
MRTSLTTGSGAGGASCHGESGETTPVSYAGTVALVGTPNCGKTTLFNWLTGSRFKTVNYPGSTVEHSLGSTHARFGESLLVMDTPGTYSLAPKSPDERVTFEAIFNHKVHGASRVIVSIADATQLWRHLLLTKQLLDAGFKVVLAVTMLDLLHEKGEDLDLKKLSADLGIPVVAFDGHRSSPRVRTRIEGVETDLRNSVDGREGRSHVERDGHDRGGGDSSAST